jgi:hypothetical protein
MGNKSLDEFVEEVHCFGGDMMFSISGRAIQQTC